MKNENWHNEEYMKAKRNEVVDLATSLLNDKVSFLEGIRALNSIRHQVSDQEFDDDFMLFVEIDSDTDHLPSLDMRANCSVSWLMKSDQEVLKLKELYNKQLKAACNKLILRFQTIA